MSKPHWTERNRRETEYADAYRVGLREGLDTLRSYLMSPKFHEDPSVQVGDVLLRLDESFAHADMMEANRRESYVRLDAGE